MYFTRSNFFPINKILTTGLITELIDDLNIKNRIDKNFEVNDISSLNSIRENSIIFISKKEKFQKYQKKNLHMITDSISIFDDRSYKNIHLVTNLDLTYSKIINHMYFHEDDVKFYNNLNHDNILNTKHSNIDKSSKIGNNCTIGNGVEIGKNCIIKNNVVLKNCIIGDNVHIGDNTTIGSTGFGFNLKNLGSTNILPHVGIVFINDNVRIGSNCSIDRGKIDYTSIGNNSMLDNNIHIAHNVIIGNNACIAAQTGISGSVKIGNNLVAGGQCGFAGHIEIGNNVIVAAKSGVTKNIKDNSIVAGFPAVDIKLWKKNIIKMKQYGYK